MRVRSLRQYATTGLACTAVCIAKQKGASGARGRGGWRDAGRVVAVVTGRMRVEFHKIRAGEKTHLLIVFDRGLVRCLYPPLRVKRFSVLNSEVDRNHPSPKLERLAR